MALTVQNLRAVGAGVEPTSLLPGQLCFNVTDKILYVGDGSSFKTNFDGTQVAGVTGGGWYAMPMDFDNLGEYYIASPQYYGDTPTDQQVLAWSTALNHPIWITGTGGGGSQVYVVTNAQVASAPGATTSAKITAAIGVASPDEGNVTIVTGLPDDVYEGLYFFTTEWVKGAAYAYPSASEVIYNNTGRTLGATVQAAIDDLDDGLIATTAIANTANSTANSALSIASAALPRTGGTMTGTIVSQNINVQSGFGVQFNSGLNGTINGINDSINAPSSTIAASGTAVKAAYDIGAAALPRTGGTMTGNITFQDAGEGVVFSNASSVYAISDSTATTSSTTAASSTAVKSAYDLANAAVPRSSFLSAGDLLVGTGAGTFTPLPAGAADYILASDGTGNLLWVSQSEGDVTGVTGTAPITVDNTDPQNPIIGVNLATTAAPGVVQIDVAGHISLVGGVIGVPDASTTVKGVVQLNNTLGSTSTTEALTAAQGKALQDQIDTLTLSNSVTLAGGYDASLGLVDGVTSQGTAAGFVDGAAPPVAGAGNVDHYLIATVAGSIPAPMQNGDWLLSVETSPGVYAYQVLGVGARPQSASYTQAGIVQLADAAAVLAGTSDNLAITPQALQDNVLDSVTTANSNQIASSTAVKTAYDAAVAAQTTANAALPKAGGTMTGNITFQDAGEGVIFNGGSSIYAISDSTSVTSSTTAASATAVKAASDAAAAAQATANAALPKAGGTMTGNITFQDPGEGVVFNGGSSVYAISDSTSTTSSTTAASATAAKTAYDAGIQGQTDAAAAQATANAAVPCASFTALGNLLVGTGSGTYSALGVGTNQQVLIADNTCATGLKWGNACYVPDACFTAKGQLIVGTGAGTYVALSPGSNGQILVPNSACANGVEWITSQGTTICGYTCTATPFNTAIGANAGDSITSATGNTTIGYNAGTALTTGSNNVSIGCGAHLNGTSAANQVAIGVCALRDSTATGSVAVGFNAAVASTTGVITAIGQCALRSNSTGTRNTAVGNGAGVSILSGSDNTLIGDLAGDVLTGSNNTFVGSSAGGSATVGNDNTFIGKSAGTSVTTGFANVLIGGYAGTTTLSNNVVLSDGSGNRKLQINENGALGVGTTPSFGTAGQVLASQGSGAASVWCTLSLACIPCSAFTAAGQLLAGTGASTFTALGAGTDGQFLVVDSTCTGGLKWATECFVNDSSFTGTGAILAGTGVGSFSALPVGANGQVLVPNSTCATGLEWITVGALCLQGYTCTAAPFNTALGAQAGDSITSGDTNTMVGYQAGTSIATTSSNTLVGYAAGACGSTLGNAVAIGYAAMQCATPGISNTGHVAIGTYALQRNTTGVANVAIGLCAMCALTTGGCNTAVGHQSLDAVVGGAGNTAVGAQSLGAVSSGDWNTAVGFNAGCGLTTGTNNVIVGCAAGDALSTTSCNVAIGANAHGLSTTATQTVAIGTNALATANSTGTIGIGQDAGCTGGTACSVYVGYVSGRNSTGLTNTYVGGLTGCAASNTSACGTLLGFCAGSALTTGNGNVLLGFQAGRNVNSGANNVAIGTAAFQTATTAASNIAVGCGALASLSTSAGNTALGHRAMLNASTAANNVVIGCSAGEQISTGSTNVFIGNTAGDAVTTGSSNTIIGDVAGSAALADNLILAAGTTIKLQVNENGAVGVGTTPSYGTAGQVLKSAGTAAAPAWSSAVYGAFSDSTTQTNVGGASGNAVTLNTTASSNGVSIVSGSQITASVAGVYNIQISLQLEKTDSGSDSVEVWFKKNGTDIANSNTNVEMLGNGAKQLFALNLVEPLTAGQYLEVWWYSADANVQLTAAGAGTRPAIPSAIVTLTPVGA